MDEEAPPLPPPQAEPDEEESDKDAQLEEILEEFLVAEERALVLAAEAAGSEPVEDEATEPKKKRQKRSFWETFPEGDPRQEFIAAQAEDGSAITCICGSVLSCKAGFRFRLLRLTAHLEV